MPGMIRRAVTRLAEKARGWKVEPAPWMMVNVGVNRTMLVVAPAVLEVALVEAADDDADDDAEVEAEVDAAEDVDAAVVSGS